MPLHQDSYQREPSNELIVIIFKGKGRIEN